MGIQSTGREGAPGTNPLWENEQHRALGVRDHTERSRSAGVVTRNLLSVKFGPTDT